VFLASTWYHGGLTATPNSNLVSNIGFGPNATHTKVAEHRPGGATEPLGPLVHPSTVDQDVVADRYTFNHHLRGPAVGKVWGHIRLRWSGIAQDARRMKRRISNSIR
jgi:hypothetical protein